MNANALYFPNLSLPGPGWTNAVALYFDTISIIAPSSYEASLSSPLTAAFVAEGVVKPLFGGAFEHHAVDEETVDSIIVWWRGQKKRKKEPYKLYRIHRGKLRHATLLRQLSESELLKPDPFENDWLIGPEPVCMRVMAMLARRVVQAEGIGAILTDQTDAFEFAAGKNIPIEADVSRRIRSVTGLLPVGPWVSPEKIARFKADHSDELRAFRGFVEQLIRRNADNDAFEQRLAGAKELRNHLAGELEAIEGRSAGSNLGMMWAKFAAALGEASPASGAIDLFSGMLTRSRDQKRRSEIDGDPLVYAARIQSVMRPRSSAELLS